MSLGGKLRREGPEALSDVELWTLVLASTEAAEAVSAYVTGLDTVSMAELLRLPGVGGLRASRAAAVLELRRRHASYRDLRKS